MFNLAGQFEQLWNEAYNDETYNKEKAKYGSTMAGIKMQRRIETLSEFVRMHGQDMIADLKKAASDIMVGKTFVR